MLYNRFLVFTVFRIIYLFQLHHCIAGPKIRQETAAERECNNFGTSVGRLEWRALLEEGELIVRCSLNHPDRTLQYDIIWTYGLETESRTPLRLCEYDQSRVSNESDIFCQYKHKITNECEYKKLMCWVKTRNMWDSESRTACISEEIPLHFATYEVPGTTDIVTVAPVRKKASMETLRPDELYLISKSEEDDDEELSWKQERPPLGRRRRYSVDMGPDIKRMCQVTREDNTTELVLWKFGSRANLESVPQSIQWNCSVSYEVRFSGIFTLFINKAIINNFTKQITNEIVLKRCKRKSDFNNKFVKCDLAWNLSDSDLGHHVVSAHFRYSPSGRTRKLNESADCDLLDDYIRYDVARALPNKSSKLTAAELNQLGIDYFEDSSTTSRNLMLPWDTLPKNNPGTPPMNSKEMILFSMGGILSACLVGCACARWRTENKLKNSERRAKLFIRQNPALRCRCSGANATLE